MPSEVLHSVMVLLRSGDSRDMQILAQNARPPQRAQRFHLTHLVAMPVLWKRSPDADLGKFLIAADWAFTEAPGHEDGGVAQPAYVELMRCTTASRLHVMFVDGEFLLEEANAFWQAHRHLQYGDVLQPNSKFFKDANQVCVKFMAFNCMASGIPPWIQRLLNSYRALNFTDTYTYMLELHMVTRRNAIDNGMQVLH